MVLSVAAVALNAVAWYRLYRAGGSSHDVLTYLNVTCSGLAALMAGGIGVMHLRRQPPKGRSHLLLRESSTAAGEGGAMSSILAMMSHEIRTPLNAILGFGELLRSEVTTERQKHFVDSILNGGRMLQRFVTDFLELSKIEAGALPLCAAPTDLREIAGFVGRWASSQAAANGVVLEVTVSEGLPPSLMIDAQRLRQVLLNLAGHALNGRGKTTLMLRSEPTSQAGNRVNLQVVLEENIEVEGGPQREENLKSNASVPIPWITDPHAGDLPLALARRLAELMGGTTTFGDRPGPGHMIRIDFPGIEISTQQPLPKEREEWDVEFNDLRPSRVLVVDDNAANLELMRAIFGRSHHRMQFASGGKEALKAARAEKPDLVLMDLEMPDMGGAETLRLMRSDPLLAPVPVIAFTASDPSLIRTECVLFDGVVEKPVSLAKLHREMSQFLGKATMATAPSLAGAAEPPLVEEAPQWRQLKTQLGDLKRHVWPGVRDGMVMSEVRRFANGLQQDAARAHYPPLEVYASQLLEDADSFAISTLQQHLSEFPDRIAELDRSIAAA